MKQYIGNSSSIGTATHTEKIYKINDKATNRRTRKKCIFYNGSTKQCLKLKISCVGPSNQLCKYYQEHKMEKRDIEEGELVNSPLFGVGMIIRDYKHLHFDVKFIKNNLVKKFSAREIREMLLNK